MEHKINKIKIHIPLVEIMKNDPFKHSILNFLQYHAPVISSNIVNLQDENPSIKIVLHIEEKYDSSPPFYVSLDIHDKSMHVCLMD
jgi:hypothetical protein